eukprot:gene19318-25970_t
MLASSACSPPCSPHASIALVVTTTLDNPDDEDRMEDYLFSHLRSLLASQALVLHEYRLTDTTAMGKGGVIVISLAAVGAVAGGAVFLFQKLKKKDELKEIRVQSMPSSRRLTSMLSMSRRPASWYETLPVFSLKNKKGMEVHITPIGASIVQMIVPDKNGKKADIVLGYEDVESYVKGTPCTYFGVVVGRVANRIKDAKFMVEDEEFKVLANDGPNALHGGALGLHKRRWDANEYVNDTHLGVELRYDSPHGEEGFPGNLHVTVTYQLAKESNELTCHITATTDEITPVNIVQHSYFNLAGHNSGSVLDHKLHLPTADHYTPVGADGIPTGKIDSVKGTPLDFTTPETLGKRIDQWIEGDSVKGTPLDFTTPETLGKRIDQWIEVDTVKGTPFDITTAVTLGKRIDQWIEVDTVEGTPFDITTAETLSKRIDQVPGGYDHNYVLHILGATVPQLAAVLSDPVSGRTMEVLTTAPGVQLYSGNFLDGEVTGKGSCKYGKHAGVCLETQGFPNAVNEMAFPSVMVNEDDTYVHQTIYRFP